MKLKLSEWASIAEIAASIAVVVTLLLVVASMRENTNAIQANTYQNFMRDLNDWRASVRMTGGPLTVRQVTEAIESGSTDAFAEIQLVFLQLWGIYEAAFFANERGVLGANEWARFERMICFERNSADTVRFWDERLEDTMLPLSEVLTPTFAEYVDDLCQ